MRKSVKLFLLDENGSILDHIEIGLPLVRKVGISEFIALVNAFFLLLRRNNIEEDIDMVDIETYLPKHCFGHDW